MRRAEARIVDLPARRPHRVAEGAITSRPHLLLSIDTDGGVRGYGESSPPGGPWWNGESVEADRVTFERYVRPLVEGARVDRVPELRDRLDAVVVGFPYLKATVEIALLDAWTRSLGVSFGTLFGGRRRESLPLRWALGATDAEEVRDEVAERRASGFTAFKLKMGALPPSADVRRVAKILELFDDDVSVVVDPNGRWDELSARRACGELEALGVDLVEQPLAPGRTEGSARLRRGLGRLGILADESVTTPDEAVAVGVAGAADRVSLKLGKSGGPLATQRVAAAALGAGLGLYGGTALETSVGSAASLHLFASLPGLDDGCELVGAGLLAEHLVEAPTVAAGGVLAVPDGPGLGVEVVEALVARFARA